MWHPASEPDFKIEKQPEKFRIFHILLLFKPNELKSEGEHVVSEEQRSARETEKDQRD